MLYKEIFGGHPRAAQKLLVTVQALPVQIFCQKPGQGGLAAAGHTDQNNVLELPAEGIFCPADLLVGNGRSGKDGGGGCGLSAEHGKAVKTLYFKGFRLKEEGGAQGIIDEVKNRLTVGKVGQIYGGPAVMGVHSHRGCVDDNRCILVPIRCRYGEKIGDGSAQSFGAGGDSMIPGGDVCAQPV